MPGALFLWRQFSRYFEERPASSKFGPLAQIILDLLNQGFRFGHLFESRACHLAPRFFFVAVHGQTLFQDVGA